MGGQGIVVKVPLPRAKPWDGAVLWGQAWAGYGQSLALGQWFVKDNPYRLRLIPSLLLPRPGSNSSSVVWRYMAVIQLLDLGPVLWYR